MSKIREVFQRGKAIIPFIVCGDPDLETTERLVPVMAEAGADLVELGIPFSDPAAEGPIIQAASSRALKNGVSTDKILEMAARIRKKTQVPMVFMTYANVVFSYGIQRFARQAGESGIDGLILPDLPFEEKEEFAPAFREQGMDLISLVAPASHERISRIGGKAEGFVYCAISPKVAEDRKKIITDVEDMVRLAKGEGEIPCAVSVETSGKEEIASLLKVSDGMIVDVPIVKLCGQYGRDCIPYVEEYIRSMKEVVIGTVNLSQ